MNPQGKEFSAILKMWDSFFGAESEGDNDLGRKEKRITGKEDFVNEIYTSHSLKYLDQLMYNQYLTCRGDSTLFIFINYRGCHHIQASQTFHYLTNA